jgi:FeS assembly SUF system regulator
VLRISKLADYAILVMVELAKKPLEVFSAQALAERAGIELPTASKVLKLLAQAGIVQSFRGPAGGYAVKRPATGISVADVISAIEGPIAMTECSIHEGLCSVEATCNARENWQKISRAVAGALEQVSLAEMAGSTGKPLNASAVSGLRIATLNS